MSPFSVKDAVRKVTAALRGAILKKQIRMVEVDTFNAVIATNSVPVKVGTEIAVQPWLVSSVESIADEKNDHSPSKLEVPSLKQRSSQLLTSKSQTFGRRVLLVDGN
eukprot:gene33344-43108_t